MLLGRMRFHALPNYGELETNNDAAMNHSELSIAIAMNDAFFIDLKELIPSNYYVPTDNEKSWLQSAPSKSKKYHKNQKAMMSTVSTKNASKRAKFNPAKEKKIEENQVEGSDSSDYDNLGKLDGVETPEKKKSLRAAQSGDDTLQSLKERLAAKVQSLRQKRTAKFEGKQTDQNKRLKTKSLSKPVPSTIKNKCTSSEGVKPKEASTETSTKSQNDTNLSYGNLLLDEEQQETKKKATRNGQAIHGIKNLLKKAEKKQKRMEDLKKTEEGKALVDSRQWKHAIEQAKGTVLRDDPVLLRRKLKKKEKQKKKSAKTWNDRTTALKQQQRTKQNAVKKRAIDHQRAGFEGKHGKTFLNGKERNT